ncbi:MAG: class I SAM-dependent rRNA methyltransferase [Chloroflexota bacterium]
MATASIFLKPGREKSLLRRHPWVFSGAVGNMQGNAGAGETVAIRKSSGEFLAWAAYSPHSQITARVWSWIETDAIDPAFFHHRMQSAIEARTAFSNTRQSALRLCHAESDGIPGFILDRYADTLVAQVLTAGAERWRETLADAAMDLTGAARLFERSDVDVRELEGLNQRTGTLRGNAPPAEILIQDGNLRFAIDVYGGHKTGYYLDQRFNRRCVATYATGREMLDCFCYDGGFSAFALAAGAASITAIDASGDALHRAHTNLVRNDLPLERVHFQEGDVFQLLRKFRDSRRSFDLIVLDPPKFAQTASQAERAARGYKDINLLAFKLLRPGGILVTFSCSGGINSELFQKIVAGAALDAGADAQILEYLHQAPDHPVSLHFPEGAYLKGLVIHKTG